MKLINPNNALATNNFVITDRFMPYYAPFINTYVADRYDGNVDMPTAAVIDMWD